MRDFKKIMAEHGYWRDDCWNVQDSTYTFETGSRIEFFSVENGDKVRGARRERLFLNECNNISFEAFEQLEIRTSQYVFLDWNPSNEFWFYTEIKGKRDDFDFIILTYKDNEGCPPEIVRSIEQRMGRKSWWQVFGLGQLGDVEGKIYKDWLFIDDIPHEARLERFGVDFGYSNDPTAIVAIYRYNGGYILDEVCYQKGMSNKQIAETLLNQERQVLVIADSAEPKSIDEIKSYGINILPAEKGKDSVHHGIQRVQELAISVTKQSVNGIKEYRNYLWMTDKEGKILNVPEDTDNHFLDASRYALTSMNKQPIISYIQTGGVSPFDDSIGY